MVINVGPGLEDYYPLDSWTMDVICGNLAERNLLSVEQIACYGSN